VADHDMTGIDDRRRLIDRGEEAVRSARETWAPLAVAMVSIDGLEAVAAEDPALADAVIGAVAVRIRALVRVEDALGHYGDDGFAIIVHGGPRGAMELANRLRHAIAGAPVEITGGRCFSVTLTVGVAVFSPRDEGLSELLERADSALDEARRTGSNRVVAV
jgi:diguanylate cyclase (GGDEF)-like protein